MLGVGMQTLLLIVVALLLVSVFTAMQRMEGRMRGLQYSVDHLARHIDVSEYPANSELRELIGEGKNVEAVRRTRETLQLSMVDAKRYVDALIEEYEKHPPFNREQVRG